MKTKEQKPLQNKKVEAEKLNGVVIGVLVAINKNNEPLVVYPANPQEAGIIAKSTTLFDKKDIGCEVALLFEGGDVSQPLVIGRIQHPQENNINHELLQVSEDQPIEIDLDDKEHITLEAKQSITLKCGRASITLTKAGKILIRGSYVLSRSSGANRIKGGTVQIN